MPPSSSSPPQRPLVVYLLNTNIAPDVDNLEFLEDIEKVYGVKCSVLSLEGKSSSEPEIEMERSKKCFDALKDQIKQNSKSSFPLVYILRGNAASYPETKMDLKTMINCPEEPMPLLDAILSFRMGGDGSQMIADDFDEDRGGSIAATSTNDGTGTVAAPEGSVEEGVEGQGEEGAAGDGSRVDETSTTVSSVSNKLPSRAQLEAKVQEAIEALEAAQIEFDEANGGKDKKRKATAEEALNKAQQDKEDAENALSNLIRILNFTPKEKEAIEKLPSDVIEFFEECSRTDKGYYYDVTVDHIDLSALPDPSVVVETIEGGEGEENNTTATGEMQQEAAQSTVADEELTERGEDKDEGGDEAISSRRSLASLHLHPRRAMLVELVGGLLLRRSEEKRKYREWSLTTKKVNVPTASEIISKASKAAQEYHHSCLPFKAADVIPSLGFPPVAKNSIWEQQHLYRAYKIQADALPNAAQTVAGVLYSVCKGVTSFVSSSHAALFDGKKKISKAAYMEFRKLRGGGMESEWELVSGPYTLLKSDNNEDYEQKDNGDDENSQNGDIIGVNNKLKLNNIKVPNPSYQHRILCEGGVGKRGFITFPSLGSLIEPPPEYLMFLNKNDEAEPHNDMAEQDLIPEKSIMTDLSSCSGGEVSKQQSLEPQPSTEQISQQISQSNLGINSMHSDVDSDTCYALLTDLLPLPGSFDMYGNRKEVQAPVGFTPTGHSSSCLLDQEQHIPHGDRMHLRHARMADIDTEKEKELIAEVAMFEKRAVLFSAVNRLFGSKGMPLLPTKDERERGCDLTEVLTFTSLSAKDMHRFRMAMILDKLVKQLMPVLPNFTKRSMAEMGGDSAATKRQFSRGLTCVEFQQEIIKYDLMEPTMTKEYYVDDDSLAIALVWEPPHRRVARKSWTPLLCMRRRPSFKDYLTFVEAQEKEAAEMDHVDTSLSVNEESKGNGSSVANLSAEKSMQSTSSKKGGLSQFDQETSDPLNTCIEIPDKELEKWEQDTITVTPAGKALVLARRMKSTGDSWLSMHDKGYLLGLRLVSRDDGSKQSCFTCHTDDNVRYVVTTKDLGPDSDTPKPDKKGIVCLSANFESGLSITMGSNGVIRITSTLCGRMNGLSLIEEKMSGRQSATMNIQNQYNIGDEKVRYIRSGMVIKELANGPFLREIMKPDGTRILLRREPYVKVPPAAKPPKKSKESQQEVSSDTSSKPSDVYPYLAKPFKDAFDNELCWMTMQLSPDGTTTFLDSSGNTITMDVPPENTCQNKRDMETRAIVQAFSDGRLIITYSTKLMYIHFPDGTLMKKEPTGGAVMIENILCGHPAVEMDLEIDSVCVGHSRGESVPISKGGERVRARIGLPDGTAAFIKYSTSFVATYNGSIKLVRRDKTSFLVEDGGKVRYFTSAQYGKEAHVGFVKDSVDTYPFTGEVERRMTLRNPDDHNSRTFSTTTTRDELKKLHKAHTHAKPIGILHLLLIKCHDLYNADADEGGLSDPRVVFNLGEDHHSEQSSRRVKNDLNPEYYEEFFFPWNGVDKMYVQVMDYDLGNGDNEDDPIGDLVIDLQSHDFNQPLVLKHKKLRNIERGMISLEIRFKEKEGKPYVFNPPKKKEESQEEEEVEVLDEGSVEFDIGEGLCVCKIEDCEHNSFILDIAANPIDLKMDLAGELEGLIPQAVSDKPIDPRLFTMKRSGHATELICSEEYNLLEKRLKDNKDDLYKHTQKKYCSSADLGGFVVHQYFHRSSGGYHNDDVYLFQEIFPERRWQMVALPATGYITLRTHLPYAFPYTGFKRYPRKVIQLSTIYEGPPLSDEGYEQLNNDLRRWHEWREQLDQRSSATQAVDPRSPEEIAQAKELSLKIEKWEKKKKAAEKRKQKEAAMKAAKLKAGIIDENDSKTEGGTKSEGNVAEARPTTEASIASSEEDEEDEAEALIDPLGDLEIKDAFASYSHHHKISKDNLRPALIQILNQVVDQQLVDECALEALQEPFQSQVSTESLASTVSETVSAQVYNMHQFRRIYHLVEEKLRTPVQTTSIQGAEKPSDFERSLYWQSSDGSMALADGSVLEMPPPLEMREIDWQNSTTSYSGDMGSNKGVLHSKSSESLDIVGSEIPVGSALGMAKQRAQARKKKMSKTTGF